MNKLPLSLRSLETVVDLTNLHQMSPAANAVAQRWQRSAQHWFRVMQDRHDPAPPTIRSELTIIEDCFWAVCHATDEKIRGSQVSDAMSMLREELCDLAAANIRENLSA